MQRGTRAEQRTAHSRRMKPPIYYLSRVQPAAIAAGCYAYFVIAVVMLSFLNPDYSLIKSFEGNYSLGPFPFLSASTFFALGCGSLALASGLSRKLSRSAGSLTGLLALGLWGVGMITAGIFPPYEPGSTVPHTTTVLLAGLFPVEVAADPETGFYFIHILAVLASLFSLALATILLSLRFKQAENWRTIYPLSSILAAAMTAAMIYVFQALFFRFSTQIAELSFNLLTFAGLLWLFLTTARLLFLVEKPASTVP